MSVDPLTLARLEQEQAARLLRTIDAERARRSSNRLDLERIRARERLTRAMDRVAEIEATQPAETLEGSATHTPTPHANGASQ
jgi:hypothetical protein